jgi:hypothetical protein
MMRCPHLLLCRSAFQIWLHPHILCRHLSSLQVSMSSMQQSMSSMQLAVHSIDRGVEQNQLDLQECRKYHHPSSSDDEDVADGILLMPEDV